MWGVNNEEALRARVVMEIQQAVKVLDMPNVHIDDRYGFPRGTMARIVNGNTHKFSLTKLLALCDELGVVLHLDDGLVDPWYETEPPPPPI